MVGSADTQLICLPRVDQVSVDMLFKLTVSQHYWSKVSGIDPLHKWRLNLNSNTDTSLASHSRENSFVLKHECEAKDVPSII